MLPPDQPTLRNHEDHTRVRQTWTSCDHRGPSQRVFCTCLQDFERIVKTHRASFMDDVFIRGYMDDLLRTMRTSVLLRVMTPYTRVTLPHLAGELNGIPEADVEALLVSLILDAKIQGKIDQVLVRRRDIPRPHQSCRPIVPR